MLLSGLWGLEQERGACRTPGEGRPPFRSRQSAGLFAWRCLHRKLPRMRTGQSALLAFGVTTGLGSARHCFPEATFP